MNSRLTVVLAVALIAAAAPAQAQLVRGAPGSIGGWFGGHGPLDPNRSSSRWTVTFDASAGIDQEPIESAPSDPSAPTVSGNAATLAVASRYWKGRVGRFLELNADGFVNRQSLATDQLRGLNGSLRAASGLGARNDASGALTASYQPFLLAPGLAGAPPVDGGAPGGAPPNDAAPPTGVLEQRWLYTMGTGSLGHQWNSRQRLELSTTSTRFEPLEGPGFLSNTLSVAALETWNMTDRTALRVGYRYDNNQQEDTAGVRFDPTETHSLDSGLQVEKRISPDRTLSFVATAGVAYALAVTTFDGGRANEWLPIGAATFDFNLTRTWTLTANVNRQVTVLSGITVSPFVNDQASLQAAGNFGRRLRISVFGAYSRGTAAVDDAGNYTAATATAQVQYGLAPWCALFSSYSYYRHELTNLSVPVGFPAFFGRQAFRAGTSLWLPLFGTF